MNLFEKMIKAYKEQKEYFSLANVQREFNKKNVFVFLYPIEEYLVKKVPNSNRKLIDTAPYINKCINKRYKDNGYEIVFICYRYSEVYGLDTKNTKRIDTQYGFMDPEIYGSENYIYADFNALARELNPDLYEEIVIGGFHSGDCVRQLKTAIERYNKNVMVDFDLTNLFIHRALKAEGGELVLKKGFSFERYDGNYVSFIEELAHKKINPYTTKGIEELQKISVKYKLEPEELKKAVVTYLAEYPLMK